MADEAQTKVEKNETTSQVKSKKRDRSASEERLLNAGLEVFSAHGYDGSTTKMIAKTADVNESLIGRYFDGKEGLLIAIIEKFLEEMVNRELPYPPQNSLTEELEFYTKDRIEVGCLHEDFAKIIFSQGLVNRTFKKRVLETIPMQLDPQLIARVQKLADEGKLIAGVDIEEVCEDVDSYMSGIFFHDVILHEKTKDVVLKRSVRFVKNYAKLFEKK